MLSYQYDHEMIPDDHILNLIAKELSGRATAEEQQQLQQWQELDPSNRKEYEELVTMWKESMRLTADQSFNTARAWNKVKAAMKPAGQSQAPARTINFLSSLYYKRLAVAAAILAVFIIGGYLWNHYRNAWEELSAASNNQSLQLPDGSTVLLRKGATLRYPLHFDGEERLVQLSGEAYFKVERDEHQPFVVVTDHAAVRVLGTSFVVKASDATDEVIVMTGKVSVINKRKAGRQVELTAGQRTLLQNDQFLQSQVSDSNFIAWNTGLLDFKDAPLEKVLQEMEDYYEVPMGVDSQQKAAISGLTVTVRFSNQPLEQALEEIRLVTGLSMKKENGKVVFYMK
jgi:transmembrane sensor